MGVNIEVLQQGNGVKPPQGDIVTVHYTGKLEDGTVFDTSYKRGVPYEFVLGRNSVGETSILTISPVYRLNSALSISNSSLSSIKKLNITNTDFGYGESGFGGIIPANSTLIFEVKLLEFRPLNNY
ncbi:hypothetical protein PPL_03648 [Heterostelium album PN500]|uniref:peptidylprolyl isomerase n=1 Tax=Heterostelium pallidum (strain ATCC 26659 / Pp 5 / PN500) TaxID=670386 RepID=D3B6A0_HETP5|nr:hypothetical protein PPL_03648 [Heterostelium album PN500]EFA82870.1 hypothetical protein PPL_03648 [Heterostelium album PN500]|eukprot:XP_020434987.1 hypothetical protein PPL_03648 [Heterostelium album PN500]